MITLGFIIVPPEPLTALLEWFSETRDHQIDLPRVKLNKLTAFSKSLSHELIQAFLKPSKMLQPLN
jgi:hypothetical protein